MKNIKPTVLLCFVIIILLSLAYFYSKRGKAPSEHIQTPEPITTLSGILHLKLFPGPPEYGSIEDGDEADYVWIVKLDDPSFLIALNAPETELSLDLVDIVKREDARDLILCVDEDDQKTCEEAQGQEVVVRGILFHRHTAHHYTPLLMDLQKIVPKDAMKTRANSLQL